ncbi:unnamed protein product [Lymnaea stagnalis]|uniref:BTB domain-containing protein n=1 Tax=Lymnaea stagnalis TaxID=6523 RepID=A0AAV2HHB1_LYMST
MMEPPVTTGEVLINNCNELSTRMLNLLMSKEMFDVQLLVGKHTFDAHKLILCSCSDVFRTMLTNQKWSEATKQSVVLVEEPVCESVFGRFLHYIYSGQLYLSHSNVGPLLTLADKYNVREMIPLCRTYMRKHMDAPVAVSCVLQWWQIANMRNDTELEAIILSYIECNFDKVIALPDFANANLETIEKLITSSRLVIHYEALIFFSVVVWLKDFMDLRHPTAEEAKAAFRRLMCHIRWPMMNEEEVAWLRECSDVQEFVKTYRSFLSLPDTPPDLDPCLLLTPADQSELPSPVDMLCSQSCDMCDSLLGCSKEKPYHSIHAISLLGSSELKVRSSRHSKLKLASDKIKKYVYMPRVYFSDYWCTKLTVSNFLAFPQYATQTFFFSTPQTGDRLDNGKLLDWEVELSPKGVRFPPAVLIGLEQDGSKIIEESYIHTVRLSVMSRSPQELPLKVEVNVLVQANNPTMPGCYFFECCRRHTCIFDGRNHRHNLDDIVPYENYGAYLHPECPVSDLYPTRTLAFTLYIVIRPLS